MSRTMVTRMDAWERLLPRLHELHDLVAASRLLRWDQAVVMPHKGAGGRARVLATLESLAHRRLVDPAVGDLLEELSDADLDVDRAAHVRVLKREYDKAAKIPSDLVRALAESTGLAYHAWTQAKPASDFDMLQPHLEKLLALKKEEADAIGWRDERYDALLDGYEPDVTTQEIETMFTGLVAGLRPIAEKILDAAGDKPAFLIGEYDQAVQREFCRWLVAQLGFDTAGGRVDESPHPFTTRIAAGDVRQTTRTDRQTILPSVYAALHETGHAIYEQKIPEELASLPAGSVPSLGMHESQSRLWENQLGRSRVFTDWLLPHLKDRFPRELGTVTPDEFHRGVNHVERGFIRVEADEVTYNLHIVFRFELELALFRDELEVAHLPDAWNDAIERHLGIRPKDDATGVLQDMHWSTGAFGYFPTYTLGTLYAAAFFDRAQADIDGLKDHIRAGDMKPLLEWLQSSIHRHAYRYPAKELAQRILRAPVSAAPFLDHLRVKYADIYRVGL
jgi:carboxypeptidase Taq